MDITLLRNETPGCKYHHHLNSAGASMPPQAVLDAMQHYLTEEALHGGYEMEAARQGEFKKFYKAVAKMLHCQPHNVAFSHSATDGFSKALSSIPFERGDVILTTDDDYVANFYAFIFLKKRFGVELVRADKLPVGGVDPGSVKRLLEKHRPKLVAVTHVPTNSGLVQDVAAIGQICRERETWYLVDACQSAGQMPLDVQQIGCDFLSATARKWLRGPRGAGFLFVSDRVLDAGLEPIFPDFTVGKWTAPEEYELKRSARIFEYWERNWALVLGAKAAVEYALDLGLENIEKQVTEIADYTRQRLADLPSWQVLDQGNQRCGIVTAHFSKTNPDEVRAALKKANVNAGVAATQNALIDFREKGVEWALRLSPHYYNTKKEVDVAVDALSKIKGTA